MDGGIGSGPRFPGDLANHLTQREESPDRWSERFRHAWLLYAVLAVAIPAWIGTMVALVVFLGPIGWYFAAVVLLAPLGVYVRTIEWRLLTGRDVDTGEKLDRRR